MAPHLADLILWMLYGDFNARPPLFLPSICPPKTLPVGLTGNEQTDIWPISIMLLMTSYLECLVRECLLHFRRLLLTRPQSVVVEAFNLSELSLPHLFLLLVNLKKGEKISASCDTTMGETWYISRKG